MRVTPTVRGALEGKRWPREQRIRRPVDLGPQLLEVEVERPGDAPAGARTRREQAAAREQGGERRG
ncbi:hypothetical protein ACOXH8_12555 [Nannocystis pusilla]